MTLAATTDGQGAYDAIRSRILRHLEREEFAQARIVLAELAQVFPCDPRLLQDMAHCYWNLGDHNGAMQLLGAAAEEAPEDATIWARLGAMAYSSGQTELARHALEAALHIRPNFPGALVALNRIEPFARNAQRARKLRALAQSDRLEPTERASVCHAVGAIEAAAGNPKAAMLHFGRAKALLPGHYDARTIEARVAAQRQHFPAMDVDASATEGPRIAFVLGLPRSGTTLVESILLRHAKVASFGESHALAEALVRLRQICAQRSGPGDDWAWPGQMRPEDLAGLRQHYLTLTGCQIAPDDDAVFVDKTPQNALDMGFASRLFPRARFIFMSRHPLDTGLSNYVTNFTPAFMGAHPWSRRLESIGHFTRCLYDSLQDYQVKLGGALRVQSYAALVKQPEAQVRAILMHLGLDWDPSCLTPEARTGAIHTASTAQVRKPINQAGLAKWRAYEAELTPLVKALGGQGWIDEWERADLAAAQG